MADTYLSIALLAQDSWMIQRVSACAAKEGITNPDGWAGIYRWDWASQPGWGEAYEYAQNTGNADPGKDPAVITDGMILSAVQSINAS